MSYYSNYEGYKPSFYESNNDDVPMSLQESYSPHGYYQDNCTRLYPSRIWNEEPQEIEQPEMSNLERLFKEAIEQSERHSRELDEIFDWNFEPNYEIPYDTFSNANEHVDDVEAIECNAYCSNDYAPYSSNFAFQDDSEDEEEENNDYTNYPQETSQVVLQESHGFAPELKECADSDFEDSDGELEIEDEVLVEEDVEIPVTPVFETVSVSFESNAVNEEHENNVENELEEEPIMLQNDKHVDELESQVSQKLDYSNLDEELYELLGLDIGELQELVNNGDGMMTEAELLESMGLKVEESNPVDELVQSTQHEDEMMCLEKSLGTSPTNFKTNAFSCECEFVVVKEPKPPDPFISGFEDLSLVKDIDEPRIDMDRGIWSKWEPSKGLMFHTSLENYSLLEDPGDIEMDISLSLVIARGENLKICCEVIWLTNKHPENNWIVHAIVWEEFYMSRKLKDNFLPSEYDWKGIGVVILDPP